MPIGVVGVEGDALFALDGCNRGCGGGVCGEKGVAVGGVLDDGGGGFEVCCGLSEGQVGANCGREEQGRGEGELHDCGVV